MFQKEKVFQFFSIQNCPKKAKDQFKEQLNILRIAKIFFFTIYSDIMEIIYIVIKVRTVCYDKQNLNRLLKSFLI